MINTYHGTGINFGVYPSVTSVIGLFQTNDHELMSDEEIIRDGSGAESANTFYAFKSGATFEYVATNAGAPTGAATVTTPVVGQMVTVTDSNYPNINGTNWLVKSPISIKRTNVNAVRVTLHLVLYPQITQ